MSKKLLYLLSMLLTIIVGCWLYYMFCCNCSKKECCDKTDKDKLPETEMSFSGFQISGEDFSYKTSDNFKFLSAKFNHLEPLSDSLQNGILKLKDYLSKENANLKITGYALSTENNSSAFPNLGFARANDVKNFLVKQGLPENKLEIFGEVKDVLSQRNDTIFGPLSFNLFKVSEENNSSYKDWSAIKDKINANPVILYFETGQTAIDVSAEDRAKIAEMVDYLGHVAGSKISVTGHTDNVGNRDNNIKLALERANFAKDYLVTNGITSEKINVTSLGPDKPIADNATAEGRAKNRRTELRIE